MSAPCLLHGHANYRAQNVKKERKNDITKDPQTATNEALCDKICLGEGQHNDIAQWTAGLAHNKEKPC